MDMELSTYYFEKGGEQNTEKLLEVAKARAVARNVKHVVVASTRGETALKAAAAFQGTGIHVVAVAHQTGHRGAGVQLFTQENRAKLEALGVTVVTGTDALTGGVSLGITRRETPQAAAPTPETQSLLALIRRMVPTTPPVETIIASVLRSFCAGVKVAVEVALMAADANVIPVDQDVVAIGGTSRGADTAILVRPANTTNYLDLDIHEIIAKPYNKA